MRRALLLAALCAAPVAAGDAAPDLDGAQLWQERMLWDGLIHARDRAARVSSDPRLLKVVLAIAHQTAQQAANLEQIDLYAKGQIDNLQFAFAQQNPGPALEIIQNNFATLAQGAEQIRNNLYYLTTRVRMCSTQALPDPKLVEKTSLLIAQIQDIQLKLNDLYTHTAAVNAAVAAETWGVEDYFRFAAQNLLRAVVEVQDSVFAVYNASYELYVLSKE